MTSDDELERRLQGWAMWRNGAGYGNGGTTSSIYTSTTPTRYRQDSSLRIDGEAMDVERVVSGLAEEMRSVLDLIYLKGKEQIDAARSLRCSRSTVQRHLADARSAVREGLRALSRRVADRLVN